ncbi:MAG: type II toxin-antitoxin system VapC family toxin [Chloroflexi bacterium]|nr:type II toxin-antitoxin system VapC family toxin [Chloroflexota bacterium]
MINKPHFVLDSFALLAFFRAETAGARVRELLEQARAGEIALSITTVNLGEVFYRAIRERGLEHAHEMLGRVEEFGVEIADVDLELALMAGSLKAVSGIGYADCFAAALAQRLAAPVVTGDPDFSQVEGVVPVEWLSAAGPQ